MAIASESILIGTQPYITTKLTYHMYKYIGMHRIYPARCETRGVAVV